MSWLNPAVRVTAALAILLTLVAGVAPVAAQGDTITVSVTAYDYTPANDPAGGTAFGQPFSYGQNFPAMQEGITDSAPGSRTILVFAVDGPIIGRGTIGPANEVDIVIPAQDYFIITDQDSGSGFYVAPGTEDPGYWNVIANVALLGGAGAPATEPAGQPAVEPTATTGAETGENPANAAPTATTAADTTDVNAEASADPSANASSAPGSAGTGSPAAIHTGTCDTADFTADPVAVLSETTAPDGETQGAGDASGVETSVTTLDLALDDILADDHVLVVFDENDASVALACGAIGGIVNGDGTLAFGLPAVGESRFSGVATLTGDGDQTEATILLAEDLSPEASPAA